LDNYFSLESVKQDVVDEVENTTTASEKEVDVKKEENKSQVWIFFLIIGLTLAVLLLFGIFCCKKRSTAPSESTEGKLLHMA